MGALQDDLEQDPCPWGYSRAQESDDSGVEAAARGRGKGNPHQALSFLKEARS